MIPDLVTQNFISLICYRLLCRYLSTLSQSRIKQRCFFRKTRQNIVYKVVWNFERNFLSKCCLLSLSPVKKKVRIVLVILLSLPSEKIIAVASKYTCIIIFLRFQQWSHSPKCKNAGIIITTKMKRRFVKENRELLQLAHANGL